MRHASRLAAAAAILILAAAPARAQEGEGEDESAAGTKPAVYLRSPDERLERLESLLRLGPARRAKALRILRQVDAEVRRAVARGNARLRALLTESETAAFDDLRDDTEGAPSSLPATKLSPMRSSEQEGRRGGQGGQGGGMGGQGQGGQGGMGGQGQGGQGVRGRRGPMGGGPPR
ncbi:MAG: hypothetical protein HY079_03455 [Elusimicrobia bacterium]|nr:hypothetical protein [Elusimicrobiota bacterium]